MDRLIRVACDAELLAEATRNQLLASLSESERATVEMILGQSK